MCDYYCEVCDRKIKLEYKKEHSNTKSHTALSMSVINRFCVKNPELVEIGEILKNMSIIIIKKLKFTTLCVNGAYIWWIPLFRLNLNFCIIDRVVKDY